MRKLLAIFLTTWAAVSMAQISGPIVDRPAFTALSETLANLAQQAKNSPFAPSEPWIERNPHMNKIVPSGAAGRNSAPTAGDVSVTAAISV
jgi:hypothetical protein